MKKRTVSGKVNYYNMAGGFWGITDQSGKQWLPINMPEQLKMENRKVKVKIKEVEGDSIFMWGTMVKIISFETLSP